MAQRFLRSLATFALPPLAGLSAATLAGALTPAWAVGLALLLLATLAVALARHVKQTALARLESERERERQRRELEALVAGSETILAALPDPILTLNQAKRVVRANPAAETLFGRDPAGEDLVALLRQPDLLEAVDEVFAGAPERSAEFLQSGRIERAFLARVERLSTPMLDGTVAVLALQELTAQKKAEQLRADFVANASHELRTPLASLRGFIETLRGPAKDDAEARQRFLPIMQEQAERMARLVDDLLSLSRIELHEHTPPSGEVALQGLLLGITDALELRAAARKMKLRLEVKTLPPVIGERDELAQVFQNLIDNAIKYGRAGSDVTITARLLGEEEGPGLRVGRPAIAVSIRDQGEGIAREHLPRLTERFYRVDSARSRDLGGTGLGLAIVKHIVNRHRAHLEIDSEPGQGSIFTVVLRVA